MRKSRFSEAQIAMTLRQAEAGTPVAEICRKLESRGLLRAGAPDAVNFYTLIVFAIHLRFLNPSTWSRLPSVSFLQFGRSVHQAYAGRVVVCGQLWIRGYLQPPISLLEYFSPAGSARRSMELSH